MMTAVLIDDERNALDVLSSQLDKYCPEVTVKKKCQSGEEGINAILNIKPDLVFLDIEMPKVNGFEVLNQTKSHAYKVIFTTAYDQFAIKAFKYSAVDYLLKPIDIEELKSAVEKISLQNQNDVNARIQSLFEQMSNVKPKSFKIALPLGEGYEMVAFSNIVRCESESNYTTVYLADKRKITLSKTLKDVEENLVGSSFFRIHNSHLINTDFINKFYKGDGGYLVMDDGSQIPISRNKRDEFYEFVRKI